MTGRQMPLVESEGRPAKTMTLPQVRDRLYELASVLGSTELRRLADQLWRRPGRRGPARNRRLTVKLAEQIRAYVADHPDEAEESVGALFRVGQGRVSEALFGFRDGTEIKQTEAQPEGALFPDEDLRDQQDQDQQDAHPDDHGPVGGEPEEDVAHDPSLGAAVQKEPTE